METLLFVLITIGSALVFLVVIFCLRANQENKCHARMIGTQPAMGFHVQSAPKNFCLQQQPKQPQVIPCVGQLFFVNPSCPSTSNHVAIKMCNPSVGLITKPFLFPSFRSFKM